MVSMVASPFFYLSHIFNPHLDQAWIMSRLFTRSEPQANHNIVTLAKNEQAWPGPYLGHNGKLLSGPCDGRPWRKICLWGRWSWWCFTVISVEVCSTELQFYNNRSDSLQFISNWISISTHKAFLKSDVWMICSWTRHWRQSIGQDAVLPSFDLSKIPESAHLDSIHCTTITVLLHHA